MISIKNIEKNFHHKNAINNVSLQIATGSIFGLLGVNGAGKSTLLKIMTGMMNADQGQIQYDNNDINKTLSVKQNVFYLPDDFFFFADATIQSTASFYRNLYPFFDVTRFLELTEAFELDRFAKIRTFSKGMKKQVAILAALCTNTQYLLCDEIFDGLDAIVRNTIQDMLHKEVTGRNLTVVIASHDLSSLEHIADNIGIIHKGGILLSQDMKNLRFNVHKFQCVFTRDVRLSLEQALPVLHIKQQGSLLTFLAQGVKDELIRQIKELEPLIYEELPLTVEEIFRYEGERIGYDINEIIH